MMPGISSASAASAGETSGGPPSKTFTYSGEGTSPTSSGNISFSSVAIGTVSSSRYVVVAVGCRRSASTPPTIVSVTVGGVSCNKLVELSGGTGNPRATLWVTSAPVTSGSTATIDVVTNAGLTTVGIGVWSVLNIQSTAAFGTAYSANVNPANASVYSPTGGLLFAAVYCRASSPATTWSGATEDADTTYDSYVMSFASLASLPVGSYTTVFANTGNSANTLVLATLI